MDFIEPANVLQKCGRILERITSSGEAGGNIFFKYCFT